MFDAGEHSSQVTLQRAYARDPIGIRPLYYGYDNKGKIIFASEAKCLTKIADKIDYSRVLGLNSTVITINK